MTEGLPRPQLLLVGLDPSEGNELDASCAAEGLEAIVVGAPSRATSALRQYDAAAVLFDMRPGPDRSNAAELLRTLADATGAPILAVTERGDVEALRAALESGAADFVERPFSADMVVERVRAALRAKQTVSDLEEARSRLTLARQSGDIGLWEYDPRSDQFVCSVEARRHLGLTRDTGPVTLERIVGSAASEDQPRVRAWFEAASSGPAQTPLEFEVHCDGAAQSVVRIDSMRAERRGSGPVELLGITVAVTPRQEQASDRTEERDALTGLVSGAQFLNLIDQAVVGCQHSERHAAILCIDLNRFKMLAGGLSHHAGDDLLASVARRLQDGIRDYDVVSHMLEDGSDVQIARIRGDEFTILLPDLMRVEDAAKVAQRVIELLDEPFNIEGREIYVTSSIGIASFPSDHHKAEELLRRAETAAHCAKQEGQNNLQFFAPSMNSRAFERLTLETSLRRAIERDELLVYYQPRVEIHSCRIVGVEALVRWRHPELGLVSPAQFIPLAEETGLIVPIGEWVLNEACRQAKEWQRAGLPPVRMAVNLSSVQFRQPALFETVENALTNTGLDAEWLELELTESILMQDSEKAVQTLNRLKGRGIHLSIDDFGTGYSSLSYLKRFPIDALKIDQSFIREVTSNPDDAAIATSIILMSRSLKLAVVAEGVETTSQLSFLRIMQCDEVQGYLFSPPVPGDEAGKLIANGLQVHFAA